MNEHSTPKASPNTFDGDAISRADREFLASLGDHPLVRHPLYSVPPPPRPNYDGCTTIDERAEAQKACFPAALDWMLVNYAYYTDAFMGKGGIISLVDGKMGTIASLRGFMQPYTIVEEGPRGGLKKTSVVDVWMTHPLRAQHRCDSIPFRQAAADVHGRRPDRLQPLLAAGAPRRAAARSRPFEDLFRAACSRTTAEREWFWHWLAHKARRPWVPMVGVIMVAEKFGTGRGTLFDILELLFGEDYVVPCEFGELTGTSAAARFNDRLANALFAVVNEADRRRRAPADAAPAALRRAEERHRSVADGSGGASRRRGSTPTRSARRRATIIATQHRDVVKLPRDDRRFEVLTCGRKMTPAERVEIRAWMAIPENIGALHRALLETPAAPLDVFDPFGVPPPFAGRLEMIGMGETRLEDAYGAAVEALEGFPLFTMTQAQRLIGYFGDYKTGDWTNMARHTVAKNAYRLRERGEPNNRIEYLKRNEIIYARTKADQRSWHPADTQMIIKQLDRTEAMIVRLVNTGQIDIAARLEEIRRGDEDED